MMARHTAKPTDWNCPLAYPIKLRDGYTIETMKQAAGLITKQLPRGGKSEQYAARGPNTDASA